ncbi:TPA: hypothetical protein QDC20_006196 [Burkholderia aenigmatica]|uniref:DUF3592 domain-containing protein n=1 Tax=Burkholderia sp. AU45251 TaxID=3059204 RepID=UPI00264E1C4B|nr:DUF3592 domain-containing protein [Burkholderia sp. AU45251]HDR9488079.1 hypothetical protein [Burkholderia aenigmatica]MDN7520881.1 hypothetical protein [Burkholderia sp. AU45251]HDR9519797.1 hypothetical protein [Burkholderia aenigmatica]HDR9596827.1 hypothetical protein [Burkholderia aenigmatica]HDR9604663.1 hypothetical protein [Burkholderia aenigmatica]
MPAKRNVPALVQPKMGVTKFDAKYRMTAAEAVVAGVSRGGYDIGHYRTVYRLITASGEVVKVAGQLATTSPNADPGDKVRLYDDPAHPAEGMRFPGFFERWFAVLILTVVGVVFAVAECAVSCRFVRDRVMGPARCAEAVCALVEPR